MNGPQSSPQRNGGNVEESTQAELKKRLDIIRRRSEEHIALTQAPFGTDRIKAPESNKKVPLTTQSNPLRPGLAKKGGEVTSSHRGHEQRSSVDVEQKRLVWKDGGWTYEEDGLE